MKVSIITPFFLGNEYMNAYQKMIDKNEASLRLGDELEVIIVNDSPGEQVHLDGIHSTMKTWKVFDNDKNMGIHASRVRGLYESTGDYIIFLDQDDRLKPYAVARFLERARRLADRGHEYDIIVSNARLETAEEPLIWYRSRYHTTLIGNLNAYIKVGTQIISPGQCLIRREVIPTEYKKNILSANGADDYYLWLLLLAKGINFSYLGGKPLYTHSYTGDNLSEDTTVTDKSTLEFADSLVEAGLPKKKVKKLKRMVKYKADFRMADTRGKIFLSLRNLDLFLANVYFKLRTHTGYGFHRNRKE